MNFMQRISNLEIRYASGLYVAVMYIDDQTLATRALLLR